MKHQYCPACGHQLTGSVDYSSRIKLLMIKRTDRTQKLIRKVFSTIQKHNRQDITLFASYSFLLRLKDVEDEKLRRTVEQFIKGEYAQKMYGLKYLIGWILNLDAVYDKRAAVEKKIYGTSPLKRTIEIKSAEYKPLVDISVNRSIRNSPALDKLRSK